MAKFCVRVGKRARTTVNAKSPIHAADRGLRRLFGGMAYDGPHLMNVRVRKGPCPRRKHARRGGKRRRG